MKFFNKTLIFFLALFFSSAYSIGKIDFTKENNIVCKNLTERVLDYIVIVDIKDTAPWTNFDSRSNINSVNRVLIWIKEQTCRNNIKLKIISDYFIGNEYTFIEKNVEYGTMEMTSITPSLKKRLAPLNKWADGIALIVGNEAQIKTKNDIPEIKNPRNKEHLIAHLKDEKQHESVCLLYSVNKSYKNNVFITVNQLNTKDVEFTVLSYRYLSAIAQNIITLFGAADSDKSLYKQNNKKFKIANEFFPNDIRKNAIGKNTNNLNVGELT